MQKTVKVQSDRPFPGVIADVTFWKDVTSYVNGETVTEVPFGVMVVEGVGDKIAVLPDAATDIPLGVVVHSHAYAKDEELGDVGLKPEITMGVLARGRIFVRPESLAATIGDPVHVRIVGASSATTATLDLDPVTANVDTIVAAATAGQAGNDLTLELRPDGAGAGTMEVIGNNHIFHYAPTVTTVANLETALTATPLLAVGTAGTGTNVMDGSDQTGPLFLSGGFDLGQLGQLGAFTNAPTLGETATVSNARWVRAFEGEAAVLEFDRLGMTLTAN